MPTTTNSEQALPLIPKTWPGAFGVYKYSKAAMRQNLGTLIWLALIGFLASFLQATPKVGGLLSMLASSFVSVAVTIILITGIRGQKISLNDAFNRSPKFFFNMVVLNILMFLSALASLLLFIIPIFIVMPRLSLATYYLVDKNMSAPDAMKASWNATKGNVGKVYGIFGATTLMVMPFITIIGIPIAIYLVFMYYSATVVLYEFITTQKTAA